MKSYYESSNYTGKIPRTMEEAFGYRCNYLSGTNSKKRTKWDKIALSVGIIYILAAVISVGYNVLKGYV